MSTIQSIKRAFDVLETIAGRPNGVGVTEIAKRVNLPKSTVSRLLSTLEELDAVERMPQGTDVRLGGKIISLAMQVSYPRQLTIVARPFLEELAQNVGEVVSLSVPDGDQALYVDQVKTQHTVQVRDWTGFRVPMHILSSGKVFMSDWDTAVLTQYLARPLEQLTAHTVTEPDKLRAQLAEIKASGIAWVVDEYEVGLTAVAAPIRDETSRIVAAIIIYGPSFRFPVNQERDLVNQQILQTASKIEKRLQGV